MIGTDEACLWIELHLYNTFSHFDIAGYHRSITHTMNVDMDLQVSATGLDRDMEVILLCLISCRVHGHLMEGTPERNLAYWSQ